MYLYCVFVTKQDKILYYKVLKVLHKEDRLLSKNDIYNLRLKINKKANFVG